MEKTCSGCGETKPYTAEFFYSKNRDGALQSRCKSCRSATALKRYHEREDVRTAVEAQATAWARANRERQREIARDHRQRHREEIREQDRVKRAAYVASPEGRLRMGFQSRIAKLKRAGRLHPSTTVDEAIGCSWPALVSHLEAAFAEGMSWENYGSWHVDHERPLARFDLNDRDQALEALSFKNLAPLWGHENTRKGARAPC